MRLLGTLIPYRPDPSIPADCPLLPMLREHVDGFCDRCGEVLTGRKKRWCSSACASWAYREFSKHHDWNSARDEALKRDGYKCVRCGVEETTEVIGGDERRVLYRSNLSVNHIKPLRGSGYGRGCEHHQDNLETLCWPCHNVETKRQNQEAALARYERQQVLFKGKPGMTMDEIHAAVERGIEGLTS